MSKFIWYDLTTPDLAAAKDFYAHVVGWKITDAGMPGMTYLILNAGDIMVGGMMQSPPAAQDGAKARPWMGHIFVPDVDKAVAKALSLGGRVCAPAEDIPGVGRFAVLADTSGAAFIVFKPNGDQQPAEVPLGTPGHIAWRDLQSLDWHKDWDFYSALFGWTKSQAMDMGPMGTYQLFSAGGNDLGGMMTRRPQDTKPPRWSYYFAVESISAAIGRTRAKGGTISEPMQVPGGWAADGEDPLGTSFSLFSLKP